MEKEENHQADQEKVGEDRRLANISEEKVVYKEKRRKLVGCLTPKLWETKDDK